MKKYVAELIGTLVLVLMGCGSAVFAGNIAGQSGRGSSGSCRYDPKTDRAGTWHGCADHPSAR